MTEYILYDDLTWPEVELLPRDINILLPLGEIHPTSKIEEIFSHPDRVVLLPPFPYGWRGSGLAISEPTLKAYLLNLLDSLREDGFKNVYCLTPQDMNLNLGVYQISLPHKSQYQSPEPLPPESSREKVVLIPIGHTEQHGFHLPLSTDTLIIQAIGQGVAQATPDLAFCLPVMPYGVSTHRQAFAGTLNAGGRAFEDFWLAIIDNLVARGFTRFYLLSGHGGNCSFLVNVVKYAGERHRRIFCATSWLYLSGEEGAAALRKYRQSPIGGMGHAGELETSLILHLRSDLTRMERVVDETNYISTPNYYMDWNEGGALIANPPWDDDTITGAYGAGSLGSKKKGRLWLDAAIKEKITHVREIHEQYLRREEQRNSGYGLWGGKKPEPPINTVEIDK